VEALQLKWRGRTNTVSDDRRHHNSQVVKLMEADPGHPQGR